MAELPKGPMPLAVALELLPGDFVPWVTRGAGAECSYGGRRGNTTQRRGDAETFRFYAASLAGLWCGQMVPL